MIHSRHKMRIYLIKRLKWKFKFLRVDSMKFLKKNEQKELDAAEKALKESQEKVAKIKALETKREREVKIAEQKKIQKEKHDKFMQLTYGVGSPVSTRLLLFLEAANRSGKGLFTFYKQETVNGADNYKLKSFFEKLNEFDN